MLAGLIVGFGVVEQPGTDAALGFAASAQSVMGFLQHNLQGALWLFLLVAIGWLLVFADLRDHLRAPDCSLEQVVRREQLLDLCANLFFGVGVVWTAVGMRDALLAGLGDAAQVQSAGAFQMLQRLVDGGILLALGTTIVGGCGGYLMRLLKSLLLGRQLATVYLDFQQRSEREQLQSLQRIEGLLAGQPEQDHGP